MRPAAWHRYGLFACGFAGTDASGKSGILKLGRVYFGSRSTFLPTCGRATTDRERISPEYAHAILEITSACFLLRCLTSETPQRVFRISYR